MNVKINRKISTSNCRFIDHFRNFENVETVQQIFGDKTQDVLTNLPIEFTEDTLYMRVDYDGRLLINPNYFKAADSMDLYLDIIHELVHVKQVMHGKNCNHELRYVERPLEIEAYRIAIDEARALGLDEIRILDYLESDLISPQELRQLAATLEINSEDTAFEGND
jgi:hypothetical protein